MPFFIRKYYQIMLFFLYIAFAGIVCVSCTNDDEADLISGEVPVSFTANLGSLSTRVTETGWSTNDSVGVFMVKKGQGTPYTLESYDEIEFRVYKPSGNSLIPAKEDDPFYYPVDDSEVYFIAIAPFRGTKKPSLTQVNYDQYIATYSYNLTTQTGGTTDKDKANMEAVDFIWCNTSKESEAKYYNKSNPDAELTFSHRFSKIEINVTAGGGVDDLSDLEVGLGSQFGGWHMEVESGGTFQPSSYSGCILSFYKSKNETDSTTFEGISLNGGSTAHFKKIVFYLGDKTYEYPYTESYKPGYKYVYNFTLTQSGVVLNSNGHTPWEGGEVAWDHDYYLSTEKEFTVDADVASGSIFVETDAGTPTYKITNTASWLTLTGLSGSGPTYQLHYTMSENQSIGSRSAAIELSAGGVTLNTKLTQKSYSDPLIPTRYPGSGNCVILPPGCQTSIYVGGRVNEFAKIYKEAGYGTAPTITSSTKLTAYLLWTDGISGSTSGNATKEQVLSPRSVINRIGIIWYNEPYLYVRSGSLPGNAVVVLKDEDTGNILWSWHIWVTDYDPDKEGNWGESTFGGSTMRFMDRNLGATSNQMRSNESFGLLYQWGRKDPQIGAGALRSNTGKAYWRNETGSGTTWTRSTTVLTTSASTTKKTILESVRAPLRHYVVSNSTADWCSQNQNPLRWGRSVKTLDDPCPAGWKVPWTSESIGGGSENTDIYDFNSGFLGVFHSNIGWFPAAGYRSASSTGISNCGTDGPIWTSVYTDYGPYAASLGVSGGINLFDSNMSSAYSIRCVKEE